MPEVRQEEMIEYLKQHLPAVLMTCEDSQGVSLWAKYGSMDLKTAGQWDFNKIPDDDARKQIWEYLYPLLMWEKDVPGATQYQDELGSIRYVLNQKGWKWSGTDYSNGISFEKFLQGDTLIIIEYGAFDVVSKDLPPTETLPFATGGPELVTVEEALRLVGWTLRKSTYSQGVVYAIFEKGGYGIHLEMGAMGEVTGEEPVLGDPQLETVPGKAGGWDHGPECVCHVCRIRRQTQENPAPDESQFKMSLAQAEQFMNELRRFGYDVGHDADYEDPANYMTVIVRNVTPGRKRLLLDTAERYAALLKQGNPETHGERAQRAWRERTSKIQGCEICGTCGGPLSYSESAEEWYCPKCAFGQVVGNPNNLQDITRRENEYFKTYGGPTEADFSINDIQREKILAYHQLNPSAVVGLVNKHGRENFLQIYRGEKVLNFEWDFIIPQYDAELLKLLTEREQATYTGTKEDAIKIDKIYERVKQLGGLYLYWA